MNIGTVCRVAAVILLLAAAQGAFGQYETSQKSPLGIGFSMVRPSDSKLTDITSVWFGASLDWNIAHDEFDYPRLVASLGWYGKSEGIKKAEFLPIKLSYVRRFDGDAKAGWFVGGGVGLYYVTYEGLEYSIYTRQTQYVDEDGLRLGLGIFGGRDFGDGWYAELRYDGVSSLSIPTGSSIDFSGLSLTVGSRSAF